MLYRDPVVPSQKVGLGWVPASRVQVPRFGTTYDPYSHVSSALGAIAWCISLFETAQKGVEHGRTDDPIEVSHAITKVSTSTTQSVVYSAHISVGCVGNCYSDCRV